MKFNRDSWLGLAILALLTLVMIAAVVQQNNNGAATPYLSTSSAQDGTLAFKLWLKQLGYSTFDQPLSTFSLPDHLQAVFIIQPVVEISDTEWKFLDEWVAQGGTLILAGNGYTSYMALDHYKFSQALLDPSAKELAVAAPLLKSPLITAKLPISADLVLSTDRTDFTPLLLADGNPVVASFKQGKGRVILSSMPELFANVSMKNDALAALTLNLAAFIPKGLVWFDEWHHGLQVESIVGPDQWLQRTSGGHALLFVAVVIFLALFLQGRGFGRPVPLLHELKRRGPLEHVTAIANLKRKAGHRTEVLRQYHQRVKRQLGARYRLDPSLPDVDYVNSLALLNSSINKEELLNLLKRLSKRDVSEAELVKLAAESAKWMKD